MWPIIPPQYEGWSFEGSRFPSYHDGEFDEFREYASLVRRETETGDRCRVHGRFLSYREGLAGGCFWCAPWLDKRRVRAASVEQPSDDDGDDEIIEVLQARF